MNNNPRKYKDLLGLSFIRNDGSRTILFNFHEKSNAEGVIYADYFITAYSTDIGRINGYSDTTLDMMESKLVDRTKAINLLKAFKRRHLSAVRTGIMVSNMWSSQEKYFTK